MKYIDAENLKTKIKGLQCEQGFDTGEAERAYQSAIKDILAIITSLQQEQPGVDLELELKKEATKFAQSKEFWNEENPLLSTARHFAKWGAIHLNTRKEE